MDKKPTRSPSEKAREDRLKAALRANLQRRKAQARARDAGEADVGADDNDKES
ncbi:MAG: hypothetical protein ORN49_08850 [Rhodobacteraceae bacterium]|nr:hypothetical protein [Paracoccaceae bacterium]